MSDLDEVVIENLDKKLAEPFDPSKLFSTFIKCIEDIIKVVETVGCAYTPA